MRTATGDPWHDAADVLTAGEFARRTGLSRKTLRGYEEIDLISPHLVDDRTGFRYYHPDQVELGVLLRELRTVGFTRADLVDVVAVLGADMGAPQSAADAIKTLVYGQAEALRGKQFRLHQVINRLAVPDGTPALDVTIGHAPAHLALVGSTRCNAIGVDQAAQSWFAVFAEACGPLDHGPMYMRFPEPVTDDLAGAVEFCVAVPQPPDVPVGTSLVHRPSQPRGEISFPYRRDLYPLIRSSLEVLFDWHMNLGHDLAGSAPEVHGSQGGSTVVVAWPYGQSEPDRDA
ncbi:MerR family transcriptional regulator [Demequina sp. TTPB684]|uniref:MerR family transcriptional regulator n=1 Tax=unclassified Demequina TaxID=2620311 RepID=UPI001CF57F1B|nr:MULTISPECIES: MerR family transcriptional regulator [unclassified Demequina]MCB2411891.1 MerR family transcriptional regulator [Demequina sp. TTPB684]UPU87369.1 MerR family transcriptional regulator [Demequina sp. TMPB413]